jgi:TonB family protein
MFANILKSANYFSIWLLLLLILVPAYAKKQRKSPSTKPDPTRTYKEVKQGMAAIFPDITEALQTAKSSFKQNENINLKFYISPTGKMSFMGFVEDISVEKSSLLKIKKDLNINVLIPVQEIETFTKVIVKSSLDKDNNIVLSDEINVEYVEIRSKSSILIVIDFNRRSFRKAYAKRWAENPDLQGTIYVRMSIDENGKVVSCKSEKSTLNDPVFENTILKSVKSWNFGKINNPGDITEIIYPFTFSQ